MIFFNDDDMGDGLYAEISPGDLSLHCKCNDSIVSLWYNIATFAIPAKKSVIYGDFRGYSRGIFNITGKM
jgi:hypothetical protein